MKHILLVALVAVAWCGDGLVVEAQETIAFPSPLESRPLPLPIAPPSQDRIRTNTKPPCAPGQSSTSRDPCEEDSEYDNSIRSYIQHLIQRDKMVAALVSDPTLRNLLLDVNITNVKPTTRFGTSESPVCDAQETLIYPQRAQSALGDWVFVVNQEGAKQAIRVEKCINEGRPCRLGMASSRDGTTCRQKYVYRRMLTLNTNKLLPEEVLMPSCCVCYTRKQGDFDIGLRVGNTTSGAPAADGAAAASDADPRTSPPIPPSPSLANPPHHAAPPAGHPPHRAAPPVAAANPPASPPAANPLHLPTYSHTHLVRGGSPFSSHPVRRHTSISNSRPYWNYFNFDD